MATPKTVVSAKRAARRLRQRTTPTFIQRSRAESSEQKAIFHQVLGAGKSRVRRRFLDLNAEDQKALGDGLERLIAKQTGATPR